MCYLEIYYLILYSYYLGGTAGLEACVIPVGKEVISVVYFISFAIATYRMIISRGALIPLLYLSHVLLLRIAIILCQ